MPAADPDEFPAQLLDLDSKGFAPFRTGIFLVFNPWWDDTSGTSADNDFVIGCFLLDLSLADLFLKRE